MPVRRRGESDNGIIAGMAFEQQRCVVANRFEVGEGIDKQEVDFAEEVAAQLKS